MKVLFLDIDGVVNNRATKDRFEGYIGIDPELVAHIKEIVAKTNCSIVLSSSWRIQEKFREEVLRHGIAFIDVTPNNRGLTDRGCEVIAWLEKHPEVDRHAILDDNSDFHKDQPLFLTNWQTGITPEIRDRVIAYLNGEEPYHGRVC